MVAPFNGLSAEDINWLQFISDIPVTFMRINIW